MKKLIAILSIVAVLLGVFAGCGYIPKRLTWDQAKENVVAYKQAISETAQEFGFESVANTYDIQTTSVEIKVGEYECISVFLYYDTYSTVESFSIEYVIDGANTEASFNVELFTEIIADISAKKLDVDLLEKFLSAPESDYSAEDFGFTKTDDMLVYKRHNMNFYEDWNIMYEHYKTEEKILRYGGFTKFG